MSSQSSTTKPHAQPLKPAGFLPGSHPQPLTGGLWARKEGRTSNTLHEMLSSTGPKTEPLLKTLTFTHVCSSVLLKSVYHDVNTSITVAGGTYTNWDVLLIPDKENDNGKVRRRPWRGAEMTVWLSKCDQYLLCAFLFYHTSGR